MEHSFEKKRLSLLMNSRKSFGIQFIYSSHQSNSPPANDSDISSWSTFLAEFLALSLSKSKQETVTDQLRSSCICARNIIIKILQNLKHLIVQEIQRKRIWGSATFVRHVTYYKTIFKPGVRMMIKNKPCQLVIYAINLNGPWEKTMRKKPRHGWLS